MEDVEEEYAMDKWPTMPDGSDFDGNHLLTLVRDGKSPFKGVWDINQLFREIEEKLGAHVIDIPSVSSGCRNYGFHMKLSNSLDIVARLSRSDVNMPNFVGYPFNMQVTEVEFEAAIYELLSSDPLIRVPCLLYYRVPVQYSSPINHIPEDIAGRRLFLFEKAQGEKDIWGELRSEDQNWLLAECAHIRASLFNFNAPPDLVSKWFLERLFGHKPETLPLPVTPDREFCVTLFTSKIKATIKNIGDMIGWEEDNATVGPIAFAAKQSLLRLIPHIIPKDGNESSLYRLTLDHGDYGIHNMSITEDDSGRPLVTSIYDWEFGCFVPAILSDPKMVVGIHLVTDENAFPSFTRYEKDASPEERAEYMTWSERYFEALYKFAPEYQHVIRAGKDARHLWFALRSWKGDDAEDFFGKLGDWAEKRMKELGITTDEAL
ncbi:hypothetical protein H2248_001753 [Termitomyces sp. 'cryptogamus']|nr:hypothetical protein H2248_001753 [Termitomyces sp. 'cryptogamus']